MLRSVLDAEGHIWKERLHWDYRPSTRLLMQYLDSHMLPGYAAVAGDQAIGYVFCVYEETKAVIGDVFAMPVQPPVADSAHALEDTLLKHLLELLVNSPQVDRIESQLLLHPSGSHAAVFREAGCQLFRRLFMVQRLAGSLEALRRPTCPTNLNCGPGATKISPPLHGLSARPIAIILTA